MSMRKMMMWAMMAVSLLAINSGVAADIKGELSALKIPDPPKIDGRLDEECWKQAAPIGGFKINGGNTPSVNVTEGKILYDDKGIYIGIVCKEPKIASLVRKPSKRDDENEIYRNDSIEVMLDPGRSQDKYFHFLVDVNGSVYDRAMDQGGTIGNKNWNADVTAASFVGDGVWSCELRIPFSSLALTPKALGAWGINLGRNKWKPAESSAIAENGSFNKATDFPTLKPLEVDLSPFLLAIGAPETKTSLKDGKIAVDVSLPLSNLDKKEHEVALTAAFILPDGGTAGARRNIKLAPESTQTLLFDKLTMPAAGDYPFSVTVSDSRTKRTLASRTVALPVKYSPLEVKLLAPFYRDTIYSSQKLETVVLDAVTPLSAGELKNAELTVTIAPEAGGEPLSTRTIKPVEAANRVSLDAKKLPDGKMHIIGEIKSADGKSLARVTRPLFKAPAAAAEWYVDKDLVLRHNGKPFWGYGWFSGNRFENEKHTVNFEYHQAELPVEEVRARVAEVYEKCVFSIVDYCPKELYRVNQTKELTSAEEQLLRERIRGLRDMPGLLGYYMEDEPDGHSALPRRYERAREIIMEEDPYHPCFQLVANAANAAKYMGGCDIMMVDPYFRPMRSSPPAMPISLITSSLRQALQAGKGKKPIWVVPQAFSFWTQYDNASSPNFVELRNQWLQSVIGGASGLMWFTGQTRLFDVDTDIGAPFIGFEDAALREALTAPEAKDSLTASAPIPKELHAAFRQVGDKFYIFAVNTAREAQSGVKLTLANAYTGDLCVVSEGRKVKAEKGVITDDFAMYAGHIYTNDPTFAEGETLTQVEARIAEAKQKRINPDNLARQDLGVTVKAPWDFKEWYPSFPPYVLIDGGHKARVGGVMNPKNGPKRIELLFPKPVTASRVLVHGNLGKYELEVQTPDGKWKQVAQGENKTKDAPLAITFAAESFQALALKTYSAVGGGRLGISEIEVFAK